MVKTYGFVVVFVGNEMYTKEWVAFFKKECGKQHFAVKPHSIVFFSINLFSRLFSLQMLIASFLYFFWYACF